MALASGEGDRDLAVNAGHSATSESAYAEPLAFLAAPPHNLPEQLTSFVGRERELADVAAAFTKTRLLTLTGAGGCGKSRLGVQAAAEALERFPDGAWWVELAPLADPALVAPALAKIFAVRPLPGQSELDAAVSYLASRRALIVLDNCEHLLEEAALVAEALVRGCPRLTVVATSRVPLGVAGETDWRVPSLSIPPEGEDDQPDRWDAVRLFIERAAKVRPGFALTPDNAPAVARICRELDGIPLAVEFAAARLRVLTVAQIARWLTDRFRLLAGEVRNALPRHRTLRASMDWSHDLLTEPERVVFRRLGVFTGGFTLKAAERVCAGEGIGEREILDLLGSLVEKSLVQAEERGSTVRYRLLETVRLYALERLAEAGEKASTRHRHRDAYLELAEWIAPGLRTTRQSESLDVLDPEAANIANAIEWAAKTEPAKALRMGWSLMLWWAMRGYYAHGEACYRLGLEAAGMEPSLLRARALLGRAWLLLYAGAVEKAIPATHEALAEAERAGDSATLGGALNLVGLTTLWPDPVGARPTLERARQLAVASGDEFLLVGVTQMLAYTYSNQDDHRSARPLLDEVLPIAERVGYLGGVAWHWAGVGWAKYVAGEHASSREACVRGIAAARNIGERVTESFATVFLALCQVDGGEPDEALSRLSAVRERALAHGGVFTLPCVEWAIALAHAAAGRLDEARLTFETLIGKGAGGIAHVLTGAHAGLAEVLRLLGDADAAADTGRRALELAARLGDRWFEARARLVLGRVAAERGEWTEAQRAAHEALSALLDGGHGVELPRALEALAEVAAGLESYAEAARVLGAAKHVRNELRLVAWNHQREEVEALLARVREALGAEAFEAAYAEGEALSLDGAVAYVRRARGERKRPSSGWESLTPTELEVARHAAAGLTNPEIAEQMFISRGTVKGHLSQIYGKLGIKNRSELAAQAARRADRTGD